MDQASRIVDKILEDADKEAQAILDEARQRAADTLERSVQQAQEQAQEILKQARIEGERIVERMQTMARLDVRKNLLSAKQEMLQMAFEKAQSTIHRMPRPLYAELIKRILLEYAQDGDVILPANRDADVLTQQLLQEIHVQRPDAGLTLGASTDAIDSGCILKAGAMERDCSIPSLLWLVREQQEADIAALLFDTV